MSIQPFRLAFREEGEFVNCYMAPTASMSGAVLLGSLRITLLEAKRSIWIDYQELMKQWATAVCEDYFGAAPEEFITQPAPEHVRSGKA